MKLPKFSKLRNKPRAPIIIRRVVGHSMVPVLPPKTLVLAHRLVHRVKVGNIVVISHEGKEKIKRISQIGNGAVFVLGDHPETSTDSRHFGWISKHQIIGKVFWPRERK